MHLVGDFVFGDAGEEAGIFVWEHAGVLGGVEVYSLSDSEEATRTLPAPKSLRPFKGG